MCGIKMDEILVIRVAAVTYGQQFLVASSSPRFSFLLSPSIVLTFAPPFLCPQTACCVSRSVP